MQEETLINILENFYNDCKQYNYKTKKITTKEYIKYSLQHNILCTYFKLNNVTIYNTLDKINFILDLQNNIFCVIARDLNISSVLCDIKIQDIKQLEIY